MTGPRAEPVAGRGGVQVTRFVCSAGPRDRPFAEEHSGLALAVVLAGCFCYRCRGRTQAMVPGSVLLGEPGEGYTCSHEHGVGDVCLSIGLSEGAFASVASECAAPGRFFAAPALPPRARVGVLARAVAAGTEEVEELGLELAAEVLTALAERERGPARVKEASPADRRRAVAAAQLMALRSAEPLTLTEVAGAVGLSPYHFLRVFRGVFGATPHQYLVQRRVERAAERLLEGESVTALAYTTGFGDLSNFVRTFRRAFGAPPGAFARARGSSKIRQVRAPGGR